MKNTKYLVILLLFSTASFGQDFSKNIATARNSYAAGNLEEARFAMQQMLNDLDMAIGREVLKMLPAKMGSFSSNASNDNVTANTGLSGVIIHREYGSGEKVFSLDLMSNSPLVASINAILSIPFMGNSGDGTQKVIRIDGYKGMLQKTVEKKPKKRTIHCRCLLVRHCLPLPRPTRAKRR